MADEPAAPSSAASVVSLAARAYETDRYLSALLSPRGVREDLIALAAFAGEIGRIPAFVSEPMMGRIRFQWWRERLESGSAGGHPVAAAMITTMQRNGIEAATLAALIDGHEDSLDGQPFAGRSDLERYLDRVDGTMFAVAARILKDAAPPDLIASSGRAYGLARLLLEVPALLAHGRLLIPADRATITDSHSLQTAARELAGESRRQLHACVVAMQHLKRRARSPFLPLALVEPYLQACEARTLPDETTVEVAPLLRMWRLLRCRWTGRL